MLNISYVGSLCKRSKNPGVWIGSTGARFLNVFVQRLKKKLHGLGLLLIFFLHHIFGFIPPEPIMFILMIFWLFFFHFDLFIFANNIKNMKNIFYTIFIFLSIYLFIWTFVHKYIYIYISLKYWEICKNTFIFIFILFYLLKIFYIKKYLFYKY